MEKCRGSVWHGGFHTSICGRGAKYECDGKWYCKTHHPPNIQAKQEARSAKWRAEWDEEINRSIQEKQAAELQAKEAAMFRHLRDNQAIVGKTEDGKWQVIYQGEVLHLGPEADSFEGAVRADMNVPE
jgi:hypothetical protein